MKKTVDWHRGRLSALNWIYPVCCPAVAIGNFANSAEEAYVAGRIINEIKNEKKAIVEIRKNSKRI